MAKPNLVKKNSGRTAFGETELGKTLFSEHKMCKKQFDIKNNLLKNILGLHFANLSCDFDRFFTGIQSQTNMHTNLDKYDIEV